MNAARNELDALTAEWLAFQREWRVSRDKWRDRVGDDFSRRFWEDWERRMPGLFSAIQELDEAMEAADSLLRENGRG